MRTANVIELKRQPAPELEAELKEELVCELLTPEPWGMTAEEVEERRHQVATIRGCPFPRCSREELQGDEIKDPDAQHDWDLIDALYRGTSPDIRYLFR